MIERTLKKQIEEKLFKGKVIILYWPRQVGKTTLIKEIAIKYKDTSKYLNCELLSVQEILSKPEAETIKSYLWNKTLIILDEAQKISNIGTILKIMVDTYPEIQIIATWSSSFELGNHLQEPLTGRHFTFEMYPISLQELIQYKDKIYIKAKLESLLRFGSYPEVLLLPDEEAKERLEELASDYLYKDLLMFEWLKKSSIIKKLLQLLALQLWNEVSLQELAVNLWINRLTVQKYIDLLEKSFVIFQLPAFSRNKRIEISKGTKIYFYDLGIRNTLIQNFTPLELRNDVWALRENFCIIERIKSLKSKNLFRNIYFWRTYTQKEVDYIEEYNGKIQGYEFKYSKNKTSSSKLFEEQYKGKVEIINKENIFSFVEIIEWII